MSSLTMYLATLLIDSDIPNRVKTRNIPPIKPADLIVTNSKVGMKLKCSVFIKTI